MAATVFPVPRDHRLDEDLAIIQNGSTATTNISSGQYVSWNGILKQALSNISSGDTLSSTNLGDPTNGVLNDLNSNLTPKAITFTPVQNVAIGLGGAFQIGRVVFFNFRLNVSTAIANGSLGTFTPKPKYDFAATSLVGIAANGRDLSNNNLALYGYVGTNGVLSLMGTGGVSCPAGYHMVTGFFVTND